jgi:hypothetical protein
MYMPNLLTQDVWKYDLSGETEYGIVSPPVDAENDFFDKNFSMQFTVFARGSRTCKDLGLKCANPKAPPLVSSQGCTADPYCNCPAKNKMPAEAEPTYLELYRLHNDISECKLIEETLGKDWLGCEWSNPESPCSCNCPEQGKYFNKYLQYTRTYATFWETEPKVPLLRIAQTNLYNAQRMSITIPPNSNVKVGSKIAVFIENVPGLKNKFKKISGHWLVSGIDHKFPTLRNYVMKVYLIRDSIDYDINTLKEPESINDESKYDNI